MAFLNIKKNQQGLLILAVVVVIIAAFALAGKKTGQSTDVVVTGAETQAESGQRSQQASPKVPAVVTPRAASLNGSTFRVSAYNGHILPDSASYLVTFEGGNPTFESGFIRAKFCNSLTSPYNLVGNVLRADLTGSKMYCNEPQGVMDIEGAFSVLVGGGAQMTLQGNALTLTDNVKTMVLIRQ